MNVGRRLGVGAALDEVFALYKQHFGVLIPVAFWLFLGVSILSGIFAGTAGLLAVGALALAVGILYQGMVVTLVRDARDGGRDSSVGELFASVRPVLATLIGAGILAGLGEMIGFLALVVPGCIAVTFWAVIAPAIVIERAGVSGAFRRSQDLVRGYAWPVFGTVIAAGVLAAIATLILSAIGAAIAGGPFLRIVFGALASTFAAPITALVPAVLYYRLLALKEGAVSPATDMPHADDPPPRL